MVNFNIISSLQSSYFLPHGELNKNGSHRLIYLNTWSEVGGTVGKELGGLVLLEKAYH